MSEQVAIASEFLLQAPPGEVNDVINDLGAAINDQAALQEGLLPALEEYNVAQLITIDVPLHDHKMILSAAGRIRGEDGNRYFDPRSSNSYKVDHMKLSLSDPQPYETDSSRESFRKSLETASDSYLAAHYPHKERAGYWDKSGFGSSTTAVFSPISDSSENAWTIELVSNKYKPDNFWSGRWRSTYEVEPEKREARGRIAVDVHYYEQGNVQLHTTHSLKIPLSSPSVTGSQVLTLISDEEGKYHEKLTESFEKMRDGGFRGLRRVLPVTREKMDWDRVMGYRLGQEIAGTRSNSA